jgi:hypothetical protein
MAKAVTSKDCIQEASLKIAVLMHVLATFPACANIYCFLFASAARRANLQLGK